MFCHCWNSFGISIHALLAESDIDKDHYVDNRTGISIHALLAESDLIWRYLTPKALKFLSTLSLRRATRVLEVTRNSDTDFYPRSPCGERRCPAGVEKSFLQISIHALLAESDACITTTTTCTVSFLSTLSLRRATFQLDVMITTFYYFYPRSPCGERR